MVENPKLSDKDIETEKGVFQLVGKPIPPTESDFGSDVYFAYNGYITISPLNSILTDFNLLSEYSK